VLVYLFRRLDDGSIEVLLLERAADRGGFWQGVTGAPEPGESDEAAAAREVREETGFAIGEGGLRPAGFRYELRPRRGGEAEWERLYGPGIDAVPEEVFLAEMAGGKPVLAPGEHVSWRWSSLSQALALLAWEDNRRALVAAHDLLTRGGDRPAG
jgi:8-oxo-dGTP pyrophosphatase MutT (NUDIX family)